ncbi:MAG TPA: DNA polymerase Y family protein [Acidimicrobiales bacterium]|nr:DNA polymerase Y family protein [Acidimicrobiales bacterium]
MRTLVVWWPDWPVVAAGVDPGVPAAVVSANRVVACSAAARAEGVKRGLRRRAAQACCPHLMVLEQDPARDARAFEPVVAAVEDLAPGVEILRPGVCAVATRGPSRYFGGDEALVARMISVVEAAMPPHLAPGQLRGRTDEQGLDVTGVLGCVPVECKVGVADGPFAAGLAARRGLIVPVGETPAFLAPFPVATLERPELCGLLVRLGLRTLGAFAALPPADVLARFGPDAALAHRLARGIEERPLRARVPPPDFAVQVELDPPALRVDTAAFAAKALADELHQRLARLGLACTRIAVEAETEHGETLTRLWRTDGAGRGWGPRLGEEVGDGAPAGRNNTEGALSPGGMAERVRWQLDGWLGGTAGAGNPTPTAGLSLLRLVPDQVVPDDGRQAGFWGGTGEAAARTARALARVQGMLGPEAVLTAIPNGGRAPAEQVTLVPWGDVREPSRPSEPPWPGRLPPPAPATVFPEPQPAEVVDAAGHSVGVTGRFTVTAAPERLLVGSSGMARGTRTGWAGDRNRGAGPRNSWADVVAWAGPWPVDERWWDRPAHRRRARFQVLTSDGSAWLLFIESGRWWAEAAYD